MKPRPTPISSSLRIPPPDIEVLAVNMNKVLYITQSELHTAILHLDGGDTIVVQEDFGDVIDAWNRREYELTSGRI